MKVARRDRQTYDAFQFTADNIADLNLWPDWVLVHYCTRGGRESGYAVELRTYASDGQACPCLWRIEDWVIGHSNRSVSHCSDAAFRMYFEEVTE